MARAWITYDTVTPESAEQGDVEERGYAAPGGWKFPIEPDCVGAEARKVSDANVLDREDVIRWARDRGPWRLNDTLRKGIKSLAFYCDEPEQDFTTGEDTTYAVHFECTGLPDARRIVAAMKG